MFPVSDVNIMVAGAGAGIVVDRTIRSIRLGPLSRKKFILTFHYENGKMKAGEADNDKDTKTLDLAEINKKWPVDVNTVKYLTDLKGVQIAGPKAILYNMAGGRTDVIDKLENICEFLF